jgi:uncharacterized protein YkwD
MTTQHPNRVRPGVEALEDRQLLSVSVHRPRRPHRPARPAHHAPHVIHRPGHSHGGSTIPVPTPSGTTPATPAGTTTGGTTTGTTTPAAGQPVVFQAIDLSPQEQLLLEEINRARANPAGEASADGISLNEGLPAGTITADPKQPLAPNAALLQASRAHSADMLARNYFAHETLGTGQTPDQRDVAAGYAGSQFAENIAERGTTGTLDQNQVVVQIHNDLFIDSTEPGRGHRTNLLDPGLSEAGVGISFGPFTQNGQTFNSALATQDFGDRGQKFLTGVVYADRDGNRFYSIGEGLAGATITATNQATGQVFRTTTGTSGGYALPLGPGTYQVSITPPGQASGSVQTVTLGQANVKVDLQI